MRRFARPILLILLLAASALCLPNRQLLAQASAQESPEAFVPSERLPAGSAVSFPVDI